jgi:hypothetical protein
MRFGPVAARCPTCGSADVIYSCAPHCCFNHVCADCRSSWQLRSVTLGRRLPEGLVPSADYDTSDPTAACAACGSLAFQIEGTAELACPACRAVLRLEYTDVRAWSD